MPPTRLAAAGVVVCAAACAGLWWLARGHGAGGPWPAWAPTALLASALGGLGGLAAASFLLGQRLRQQAAREQLALQRCRQATQQLLDALPVALGLGSAHGDAIAPNPALRHLLGADPAATLNWPSMLTAEDHEPWQAAWQRALASGRPQWLECSVQTADTPAAVLAQMTPCAGDEWQLLVCLTPLQGDSGTAPHLLLQLRRLLELTEGEKWHFGQAVHDELGQRLSGMAYFSKALQRNLQKAQRPEAEDAGWLTDLANESMAVARSLARGLQPVGSDDPGALGAALAELCEKAGKSFGVDCRLSVDPGFDAGNAAQASHLYHAVQELVNNAVRHGQAQQVQVQLRVLDDRQSVIVDDDGQGLPPPPLRRGMGLAGVRSRATYLGAQFAIANKHDRGVQACIEWPLPTTA